MADRARARVEALIARSFRCARDWNTPIRLKPFKPGTRSSNASMGIIAFTNLSFAGENVFEKFVFFSS
jgi:hypothetical protein